MQRHRHQEFIRFLNAIEAEVPAGKAVHVILNNYATHKHLKVRQWLARHERSPSILHRHPAPGSSLSNHHALTRQVLGEGVALAGLAREHGYGRGLRNSAFRCQFVFRRIGGRLFELKGYLFNQAR